MSAQIQMSLSAYVPGTDLRLNQQDSLARLAYAKNKIRSATKVRVVDKSGEIDTVDYAEFDHQGNRTLLYNPDFKARTVRRFDKLSRLLESIQQPTPSYPYLMREVLDPDKGLYTSFRQPEGSPDVPLLTVTQQRHGDTLSSLAILHQPVPQQGYTLTQVTCRRYSVGRDTIRQDHFGYDEFHKPQAYQSTYTIRRNGNAIESGVVSFQKPLQALLDTSARARRWRSQGMSDAAILLSLGSKIRDIYLATSHSLFDKNGWLLHSEMSVPAELSRKSGTQETEKGSMTLSASQSSQVSYRYDARGNVIREERTAVFPSLSSENKQTVDTWVTVKDNVYSSKGLLLNETSSFQINSKHIRTTRYEHHYTRF
ncbi:hypothetical protein [Hymenobacter gelipurpurascens]|nr:hypothetical protein [Hymenobacter gelipurpurascens]